MLICWAVLGGFVLDAIFRRPGLAAASRCADGQSHHRAGKTPARTISPNAAGASFAAGRCWPPFCRWARSSSQRWCAGWRRRCTRWRGLPCRCSGAQALAARGLVQESRNVYKELQKQDLPAARKAVARIVGRDTQNLTAEGVTKAAVETVAENASDGVIAPLLYMLLGGAPLALTYKAINTMDSMLGYKNEKYLYFGRAAARLDDVANYLPSRIAGLLWVAAAALTGQQCPRRMEDLAAGQAQPCQPQQCPDRECLRRCTECAAGGPRLLFWRVLR